MPKLKGFPWIKKDKTEAKTVSKSLSNCSLESQESIDTLDGDDIPEDLQFYLGKRKRQETDEDAFSVHSVDCKQGRWNRSASSVMGAVLNRVGLAASALSIPSMSYRSSTGSAKTLLHQPHSVSHASHLNMISERAECPQSQQQSLTRRSSAFLSPLPCRWRNARRVRVPPTTPTSTLSPSAATSEVVPSSPNAVAVTIGDGKKEAEQIMSKREFERQSIIHELYTGEVDTVNDLHSVMKNYKEPMENLGLLSDGESFVLFYKLDKLIPLHEDLVHRLESQRDETDAMSSIGKSLLKWVDDMYELVHYCAHLRYSKALLEEKRGQDEFADFLNRCLACPFSRKLDLWDFLDKPRMRLMKYPLILDRIIKYSPKEDEDLPLLKLALKRLERLIGKVDERTGEEMCNFFLERFDFVDENEHIRLVKSQKVLLVEGNLRTGRGTKVHAFLFQDVLVLTLASGGEFSNSRYRVYRDPLPTAQIVLENLADGEVKIGSFRSTFCTEKASRNIFRLTLLSDWKESQRLSITKTTGSLPTSPLTSSASLMRSASNSSTSGRLKSAQTILQTAKEEEKHLWLNYLRKVVGLEVPKAGTGSASLTSIGGLKDIREGTPAPLASDD